MAIEVFGKIDGDEIVYHDYVDISVAVSAPNGLVVPVIRNAEQKVERLALHEPLEILPGIRTGQATPLGPAQ